MDYKNENKGFSYVYSAKDIAELKRIREKYTPQAKEEDKITRIRRLDASVIKAAQAVSLILGVIGALVFGFGMSLCMTELADILSLSYGVGFALGISFGLFGGILATLAYPVYNLIVKRKRAKIAPEIIRLSDELLGS